MENGKITNWRTALQEWLSKNNNQKTMPEHLRQLREEFERRFPRERLGELTLEEYAPGHSKSKDSFCYWIEFKTKDLGGVRGGSAAKWGVWWSQANNDWRWNQVFQGPEDAISRLREGLVKLIQAAEEKRWDDLDRIGREYLGKDRYALRMKPLYLYFPDEFLPISSMALIDHFLAIFGEKPVGDLVARNRQLLGVLRSHSEFAGFDTQQMGRFLYECFWPPKSNDGQDDEHENGVPGGNVSTPEELKPLVEIVAKTRNVILYGPPGTGKTWLVKHFANYFLLYHNVSKEQAQKYWEAVTSGDTEIVRTLEAQARAGATRPPDQLSYWWVTANEAVWTWDELSRAGEVFFHKRKRPKHFERAREGDIVFGYLAGPSQVVMLARVKKSLHVGRDNGAQAEGILIEPLQALPHPIAWQKLVGNTVLKRSEPVKNGARDTLFRLTSDEAKELLRLLAEAGNDVQLPAAGGKSYYEFVTFHQSFAYEEFVEGLRPQVDDKGQIQYCVVPGVFRRICEAAARDPEHRYLLVIDEINRANIAKVFGELITLIEDDKRLAEANALQATLPYSKAQFGVPSNLYLIGTMNTADRSIALLDLALRRRFAFVETPPDLSKLEGKVIGGVPLAHLLRQLNERIAILLDRDHRIGQSYFLNLTSVDDLRFSWYRRIVPLLQEYFYNDYERLRAVLGDGFVRRVEVNGAVKAALGDTFDPEAVSHEIRELDGDDFLTALKQVAALSATDEV